MVRCLGRSFLVCGQHNGQGGRQVRAPFTAVPWNSALLVRAELLFGTHTYRYAGLHVSLGTFLLRPWLIKARKLPVACLRMDDFALCTSCVDDPCRTCTLLIQDFPLVRSFGLWLALGPHAV